MRIIAQTIVLDSDESITVVTPQGTISVTNSHTSRHPQLFISVGANDRGFEIRDDASLLEHELG